MARRWLGTVVAAVVASSFWAGGVRDTLARSAEETPLYILAGLTLNGITILDLDSLKRQPGTLRIWAFKILPPGKTELLGGKAYTETRVLYEINCQTDTARITQLAVYNGTDYVDGAITGDKWSVPIPDSSGEYILEIACGRQPADKLVVYTSRSEVVAEYSRYLKSMQSPQQGSGR